MDVQLPLLAIAYGTDLVIGDPHWLPHPVRGMGLAIHWGERFLRRVIPWERAAGFCLVVAVVGVSYGATAWLLNGLSVRAGLWGFWAGALLLFTCLSTKDLADESRGVLRALETGELPEARRRLARIVGRDTDRLDRPEIVRATVETIAESTLDGILSPLVYFVLGGVPLAVAYKAINTLDSMIGHRSARYVRFGWAAATLDTAANWIPARLSTVIMTAAAWIGRYRASAAWRCAWRDGSGGPVPNAGIPEAAMAGALGVRLGGVNWYERKAVERPFMGDPIHPLEPRTIRDAILLMYACSVVAWLAAMGALRLFSR